VVTPENETFYRNFYQNAGKANKHKVYCSRRRRRTWGCRGAAHAI